MPNLPGINHERAVRAFEKLRFWIARQGKHITMTNGERIITQENENQMKRQPVCSENRTWGQSIAFNIRNTAIEG